MFANYMSPIGNILIGSDNSAITSIDFLDGAYTNETGANDLIGLCISELEKYFNGSLKTFTTPIKYSSTPFMGQVYDELLKIPYGKTVSYSDIAIGIKNPKAVRAVGSANNKNKISIIVPCHRVIGKNGQLVGYGGGLWRKKWLLGHEQKFS
ncbi:MAG: methylated-DNA--[protein]-cysteine S-methyltransferase [Clostridiales bacterium]|jgi:methylated-DNA-[protein]-cysteine S-methyltransferase|nr:methylated-DNA--[protein]-cysteine S-methyltransferase [Clostridiales bacterium]